MRFRTIKQLRISNKITFFKRYQLTLYRYNSDIVSGILFDIIWHIVWHSIWNSFWHIIWNYVLRFIWHIFWQSVRQSIFHWHSIWHSPWHVFGPMRAQLHPEIAIGFGSRHAPDQCVPRLNLSFGWESGTCCELRAHWCPQSPRAGRGRRCGDEEEGRKSQLEEGVAPLSKTREPHLAGGEQSTWISTSHGQVMAQRQRHSTRRPIFAGCWKLGSAGISCPRNLMALNNPLQWEVKSYWNSRKWRVYLFWG